MYSIKLNLSSYGLLNGQKKNHEFSSCTNEQVLLVSFLYFATAQPDLFTVIVGNNALSDFISSVECMCVQYARLD